jgi:cellulose synthase/poly-beta-1,6-N-acetylglucosamine synthase-like glycosyltransferase
MGASALAPRLSVVMACRDAREYLGVQLAALASQQCPVPWELLVCDNGSRDGTVELAESWADRLPLRIVDAAAIPGAGPARNMGVQQAHGEWIGFCDADDEVGGDWLATLCRALAAHSFVAGRFEGERLNSARALRSRMLDQQVDLQRSSLTVGLPHAGAGNLGIHRSLFLDVGGFDPAVRYLQDTDLCWRVQLAGHPLVFVPDLVMHVRLRATLRGMYRQGRNYGLAQAALEHRYAGAAERLAARASSPPATVGGFGQATVERVATEPPHTRRPAPTTRLRALARTAGGAVRLARYFVEHRSSLGAQVWQIGWHLGHRS